MAKITEIKNEKNGNYVWIDPWFCEVISRCIYETMNNKGLSNYTNLIISKFYNFIKSNSLGAWGLGIDGVGLYFEKEVLEDATSKSQLIQILKDSKVHIDTFATGFAQNLNVNPTVKNRNLLSPFTSELQVELYEGGGEFRTRVFRAAEDCINRRSIGKTSLPLTQSKIDFCPICKDTLNTMLDLW